MASGSGEKPFVQFLSIWKLIALEAFSLSAGFISLTDWFAKGAEHHAPPPPGVPYLFSAFGFLGALAMLPFLWRAIRGLPAIEVTKDRVTVFAFTTRCLPRASIRGIVSRSGTVTLQVAGERSLALFVSLYSNSAESLRTLRSILAHV